MGKSMDYCKRGPLTKPNSKDEVKSETKSNPDGSYTMTKSKGDKSASTTYKKESTDSNVYVNENGQKRTFTKKKPDDKVATKKPGDMEKIPTLGAKKLSTGSYTRETDEYKYHTSKKKAVLPKKKVKKAKY